MLFLIHESHVFFFFFFFFCMGLTVGMNFGAEVVLSECKGRLEDHKYNSMTKRNNM